jgi:hypothetical protein
MPLLVVVHAHLAWNAEATHTFARTHPAILGQNGQLGH